MRSFHEWSALFAASLAMCVFACADPDLKTDLDTQGPPEVTMVNVPSQSLVLVANGGARSEVPTFCADQEVRPHFELCDPEARTFETVADAQPIGWYARVVFTELLDPTVEELVDCPGDPEATCGSLASTQPVTLTCAGSEVAYDGFYDPSGNDVTFPPGPALVIQPTEYIAAGTSDCQVEVKAMVQDKEGNAVPDSSRGPYDFGIAAMAITGNSPPPMSEGNDPTAPPQVQFNVLVDVSTVGANVTLHDDTNDADVPFTAEIAADPNGNPIPNTVNLTPDAGMLDPQTAYTVTVTSGIADVAGATLQLQEPFTFSFTTGDVPPMN